MDLELTGRRVLITGASRGIGLACAGAFAAEGCELDLTARDEARLDTLADRLRAERNATVRTFPADLSVPAEQDRLVAEVGEFDILVNNAGAIPGGDLALIDDRTWRGAWDLKVFGYVALCRLILPRLEEQGSGVIVNVIGGAAVRPRPNYIAGAAGNSALAGFTQALGSTSMRHGVRVVGVHPGLIATDRMTDLLKVQAGERFGDPQRWREMIDPDRPPGRPEHIADVVAFLASPRAGHVSGALLIVDAGQTLQ